MRRTREDQATKDAEELQIDEGEVKLKAVVK